MNDDEIDTLIAAAGRAPVPLGDLATQLRERTMTDLAPYDTAREPDRSPPRRWVLAAAAVVVLVAVGGMAIAMGADTSGPDASAGPAPETSAPAVVPAADGPPRLLVRADGWDVTWVEESPAIEGMGEVRYGLHGAVFGEPSSPGGENTLELTWRPPPTGEDRAEDPEHFAPLDDVTIAGRTARLYASQGVDTLQAQWVEAGLLLEVRGDATTEAEFRTVVATIEAVDLDTWLAALPDDVVRPDEWAAAVAEARTGVPTPSGFDEAVWDRALTIDRTALASHVAGTLACAWIDRYAAASTAGDAAALDEATEALVGIDDWPVLSMTSAPFATSVRRVAGEVVANGVVSPPNPEAGGPSACLSR